jgi:hypothetical protein
MNTLEEKYRTLFGAYLGMMLLDEYPYKAYKLKEIKDYINDFTNTYQLYNYDFNEYLNKVDKLESDIVKLQDLQRVGLILEFDTELKYIIKQHIKDIKKGGQDER